MKNILTVAIIVTFFIVLILCNLVIRFYLFKNFQKSKLNRVMLVVLQLILSVVVIQCCFAVLIERELTIQPPVFRRCYEWWLDQKGWPPADRFFYKEHHYMNYILNAGFKYDKNKQLNNKFKIRRSEVIRPKNRIKWRILILGGSTTFGEGIPEENTWVYKLEQLIRSKYGNDYDVINGGVGGYTIAENYIHYITLLTHLQPDVVLLYTGINDVHPRLYSNLEYDYSNYRIPWRLDSDALKPCKSSLRFFSPYCYYYLVSNILQIKNLGIDAVTSKPYPPHQEWKAALSRNGPDIYNDYLENLVVLIRGQGRQVGIIPQYFRIFFEDDDVFAVGVNQHNNVGRQIAIAHQAPYADEVIKTNTFLGDEIFDNCHFNEKGSKRMSEIIFDFLIKNELLSTT